MRNSALFNSNYDNLESIISMQKKLPKINAIIHMGRQLPKIELINANIIESQCINLSDELITEFLLAMTT